MKVCRFDDDRIGLVRDGLVYDTTPLLPGVVAGGGDTLMQALPALRALGEGAIAGCTAVPVASVRLLAPVRTPSKIMAASNNYGAHHAEMVADPGASFGRGPVSGLAQEGLFLKANSSLVGPSEGVALRHLDRRTDHEVELVAVIGRRASDVAEADALSCVAGYCLGLDITLRGTEERSLRKSLDSYTVLGPWLVTADEVPDPMAITLRLSVDAEVRQDCSTRELIAGVPALIAYASRFYTLLPGDLIYTGTPAGVGPIRPGVVLRASGTGLGSMDVAVRAAQGTAVVGER